MSKADFYSELVSDVENLVINGEAADSAIMLITLQDEEIDGPVLKHWVMKRHGSESALESWAEIKREELEVARQVRELARVIFEANTDGLKQFSWWKIDWESELEKLLKNVASHDLKHENTIRADFLSEADRLDRAYKAHRA